MPQTDKYRVCYKDHDVEGADLESFKGFFYALAIT